MKLEFFFNSVILKLKSSYLRLRIPWRLSFYFVYTLSLKNTLKNCFNLAGDVVKLYALQLLSLVKETMDIDPGRAFKLETPYGLQLKWALPNGMPFVMHLKDKVKVLAECNNNPAAVLVYCT